MTKRRPTIYDIAAAAGVSRQTVTRAMNGLPDISPETRERVLRVSEQLGYRRSRFATNLVRQHSFTVGFVVSTFRNPYYSELTADILDAVTAEGWQLALYSLEHLRDQVLAERVSTEVDAIVGYFTEQRERVVSEAGRGVPVVVLERPATLPGVHSVAFDWEAGMSGLVEGLRARGSRRFAMLEIDEGTDLPTTRRRAYEHAVDPASAQRFVVCEFQSQSVASGADGFRELRERFPEADTVVAFSDLMAMGALQAARELGVKVPDEVRIVGIDGLSLDSITSPTLSSLWIDRHEVAHEVVTIVKSLVDQGSAPEAARVTVVPRPIWRGST